MATTKLKLRTDRKNTFDTTTVYVQVCINSKIKLYSSGFKVKPEHWDETNQKVRKTFGYGFERHWAKINKKKIEIDQIIDHTVMNNIKLTFEYITEELRKLENIGSTEAEQANENAKKSFYEVIEDFIKVNSLIDSKDTTKHRQTALNKLKTFFGKKIPTFSDINYQFYTEYINWLIEEEELMNSSVNKQLDYLKTFMGYASKLNLFNKDILKNFDSLPEADTFKVYISQEELKKIWEYKFQNERLERVRDLFVFGCATGLRESDFSEIKPENVKKDEFQLISIKLKKLIIVPINKYSKAVLDKYNNLLPKYSQQNFNDYIKEALEEIGIDTPEQVITYKKGIRNEEIVPKYKLVSSHTARRTFITQSILRGIPIPIIQKITGHKDLRSFERYIRITEADKRNEMSKWED
ncbi:tyrosine-type recombinase/integrase [Arcicella sp. LKC2W]|uniref:tyrosine-type recombinase/integrase n=1 Tax=Arcicella sp. LKC2W TaxID=2984198 RepID=UPI002B209471|nr:tyrosine-type recombinase/integrase [Arcicella sp. LKC2W]MEA5459861.1 tyrosine-type recombinase/integrase [Arcicella sp. LKC2W]